MLDQHRRIGQDLATSLKDDIDCLKVTRNEEASMTSQFCPGGGGLGESEIRLARE